MLPGAIGRTIVEFGRVVFNGFVTTLAGGRFMVLESREFGFIPGCIGMKGDIIDEPELSEPDAGARADDVGGMDGTWTVVPSVGKNMDVVPDIALGMVPTIVPGAEATPFGFNVTLPAAESTRPVESEGRGPAVVRFAAVAPEAVALPPSPAVPAVVRLHPMAIPAATSPINIAEIVRLCPSTLI